MIFLNNSLITFIIIIVIAIWVKPGSSTIDKEMKKTIKESCEGIFAIFGFEEYILGKSHFSSQEDLKKSILDGINSLLVFIEYNQRGRSLNIREKSELQQLRTVFKEMEKELKKKEITTKLESTLEYFGVLKQKEQATEKKDFTNGIYNSLKNYFNDLYEKESEWQKQEKKNEIFYSITDYLLKYCRVLRVKNSLIMKSKNTLLEYYVTLFEAFGYNGDLTKELRDLTKELQELPLLRRDFTLTNEESIQYQNENISLQCQFKNMIGAIDSYPTIDLTKFNLLNTRLVLGYKEFLSKSKIKKETLPEPVTAFCESLINNEKFKNMFQHIV